MILESLSIKEVKVIKPRSNMMIGDILSHSMTKFSKNY